MSAQWDVLDEVPAPAASMSLPSTLSWRGDGEQFALLSHDEDSESSSNGALATVRIYSKELELQATGRNVAEGAASVLRGLKGAIAFATNGSLVACAFERVPGRLQVAFIERNGLRHGEFDIRVPDAGDAVGEAAWRIDSMHWDLSTSVLAVGLVCNEVSYGVVQLYHRNNYHWYLKQQFSADNLRLLGFDSEVLGRVYLSRREGVTALLRIVEVEWDVTKTDSRESTVAVIDGNKLLLTPLGRAIVPPPMSMYHVALPGPCRHCSFLSLANSDKFVNGILSLCDSANGQNTLSLHLLDSKGIPVQVNGKPLPAPVWTFSLAETLATLGLGDCAIRAVEGVQSGLASIRVAMLVEGQWREGEIPFEHQLVLDCHTTAVVSVTAGYSEGPREVLIVFGLTTRNRLYCGETLLVAGASSFAINRSLGVLLYITVGTTPALHFIPLDAVAKIDALQGVDGDDQYRPEIYDAAFPPRPVERGSRLVAAIPGDPNVVVQLPRGNLEAFEPRALLLARTRSLLDSEDPEKYLQCLTLLRRQRIDMNFLVDYKPKKFEVMVQPLVSVCLKRNADALSLLITSLNEENVSLTKYPAPVHAAEEVGAGLVEHELPYAPGQKVNALCSLLRIPLLDALQAGEVAALQPALCTLAKQTPPLLEEALGVIEQHLLRSEPQANLKALLNGPKGQTAIKYLAFLADGQALFDAAISMCNFTMGRAVARQCQMDPKAYLPLLQSFEILGGGADPTSKLHADMRVAKGDLFTTALPLLSGLLAVCKAEHTDGPIHTKICTAVSRLISDVRLAYGDLILNSKALSPQYSEAISAFMTVDPPAVEKAIAAARKAEDWQTALSLAARHSKYLESIVIIDEFRAGLEQADAMGGESWASAEDASSDKVVQVSQMCIDYLQDIEGAATILLLAQRYKQASQLVLRHNRADILLDDVSSATIAAAERLISEIDQKGERVIELNRVLSEGPWADPDARLKAAQAAEPTLRKEVEWLDAGGEEQPQVSQDLETRSDFSAATARSDLSYVSMLSSVSGASSTSGASTVSVLSDLETSAEKKSSLRKAGSGSQFSIAGLDHTLLSRGTGKEEHTGITPKDADHARRQAKKLAKKALREENRGRSKDSLGFNSEARQATELLACAQISTLANMAGELCEVLLLLGGVHPRKLAMGLQSSLDAYTAIVRANPAPVAPLYPRAWLASKAMLAVRSFQDPRARSSEVRQATAEVVTWWQAAARGVSLWHDHRRRAVLQEAPFQD
eukprot:GSChrysophyteH1.ASY1.ANO1.2664.1 assembled CDS